MQTLQNPSGAPEVPTPVMAATEMQDALLLALRDLQRLEGLLDHAAHMLLERFDEANSQLVDSDLARSPQTDAAREALRLAVTELQFHDMSSQLITHIASTLQACAFRLGATAMDGGANEAANFSLLPMPVKPNPVTQSEMDAGSVELF